MQHGKGAKLILLRPCQITSFLVRSRAAPCLFRIRSTSFEDKALIPFSHEKFWSTTETSFNVSFVDPNSAIILYIDDMDHFGLYLKSLLNLTVQQSSVIRVPIVQVRYIHSFNKICICCSFKRQSNFIYCIFD